MLVLYHIGSCNNCIASFSQPCEHQALLVWAFSQRLFCFSFFSTKHKFSWKVFGPLLNPSSERKLFCWVCSCDRCSPHFVRKQEASLRYAFVFCKSSHPCQAKNQKPGEVTVSSVVGDLSTAKVYCSSRRVFFERFAKVWATVTCRQTCCTWASGIWKKNL